MRALALRSNGTARPGPKTFSRRRRMAIGRSVAAAVTMSLAEDALARQVNAKPWGSAAWHGQAALLHLLLLVCRAGC